VSPSSSSHRFEIVAAASGIALFASIAITSAFSGCGGVAPAREADAASAAPDRSAPAPITPGGDDPLLEAGPGPSFGDLPDAHAGPTWDSGPAPDAGPPPSFACIEDAGAEGGVACPLPASTCLDQHWLLSYGNGVCADGVCTFTRVVIDCTAHGTGWCSQGQCGANWGK
jgi:hypothetical protein